MADEPMLKFVRVDQDYPDKREADITHMDTDLVRASRFKSAFH